jgi:hypothetical protein
MNPSTTTAEKRGESIELPAPTGWPMVLAFGVALLFAGLATTELVSGIGALLALAGVVGWFREVLPQEAIEHVVPVREVAEVSTTRREVERVGLAMELVRARLPLEFYPVSAGIRGGLAGAVAMAFLAMLYGLLRGYGVWYPINLLAAGFFPSMSTASDAQLAAFNPTAFAIASGIHLLTSLLVGVVYGAMSPILPQRPILLGGLVAPLLWTGLLYSTLAWINPVLHARISWGWFVLSQIGFGVVAGLVVSRRQRVPIAQPMPLVMRAGIEASGLVDDAPGKEQGHE